MKILTAISICAVSAPFLVSCSMPAGKEKKAEKPNILFLFADDHAYDAIGAAGNLAVSTPNLDRLAANGLRFSHCFNQGSWAPAVCLASRAMLISGKYIYHARRDVDTTKLWAETFSEAGYETFLTGKWHNKDLTAMKSFNRIKAIAQGMYETTEIGRAHV